MAVARRPTVSPLRIVGVVFCSGPPGDRMVGRPPVVWRGRRRGADTGDVGSDAQREAELPAASAVQRRVAARTSGMLSVSA